MAIRDDLNQLIDQVDEDDPSELLDSARWLAAGDHLTLAELRELQ